MLTECSLNEAVEGYDTFADRYRLLCGISAGDDENWASESLARVLEDSPKATDQDGFAVYEMLKSGHREDPIYQRQVY